MSDKKFVVINRGSKTFNLKDGPNGEKRDLGPGKSIECLDEAEYKQLMSYFREIADADNVVPANAKRIADMQDQINKLQADNAKYEKAAKLSDTTKDEEPVEEKEHSKPHKKGR